MSGGQPDELRHHRGEAHDIAADGGMGTATRRDGTLADPLPEDPAAEPAAGGATPADVDRAMDALTLAWGDDYDQIWLGHDGQWGAHHKDADADDVITAASAEELDRAIREREVAP